MVPITANSLRAAIRPINIIKNTTPKRSIAVEKFSIKMRAHTGSTKNMIYLNILGLAPSSSCFFDKRKDTKMMIDIFAISEG